MTWTKLSDTFAEREDLMEVSRSARLLLVEAMVWCNRHLLDGRITAAALRRCTDAADVDDLRDELVAAGALWPTEDGKAWLMDWSDQELAETVIARQEARAETQKRYRERAAKHKTGDHSTCDPRFCRDAVTGNATSHETGNETSRQPVTRRPPVPTRPVPSRPEGTGTGTGVGPASAGAPPVDAAGDITPHARFGEMPAARRLPDHHAFTGDCCSLPDIHPVHREVS